MSGIQIPGANNYVAPVLANDALPTRPVGYACALFYTWLLVVIDVFSSSVFRSVHGILIYCFILSLDRDS